MPRPAKHPPILTWSPWRSARPAAAYMLSIDDIKEFPKYENSGKEIFQIRRNDRAELSKRKLSELDG